MVIVIFIVIGGFIFLSGSKQAGFQFQKFNPFAKGTSKSGVLQSPTPSSVPSPDTSQKLSDKSQMAVEVINGTGKAGQAGKVKSMLENLGFSDIATENAQDPKNTITKVEFSNDIPSEVRSEVENELKGTFETVETEDLSSDSNFKIVITTGTENNP